MTFRSLPLISLLLSACPASDTAEPTPPTPEVGPRLAKASPAQRLRAVQAASGQDARVAVWSIQQANRDALDCMKMELTSPGVVELSAPAGCTSAAGTTFAGKATIVAPNGTLGEWDEVSFDQVRIGGELGETVIDGTVSWDDARAEIVDLTVTRAGIAVHTLATPGDPTVIDVIGVGELAVEASRDRVTLTGADVLTWTRDTTTCGTARVGTVTESLCPWTAAPSRFTSGSIRHLAMTCTGDDGSLEIETDRPGQIDMYLGGIRWQIGGATFDETRNTYVFTANLDCARASTSEYEIRLQVGDGSVPVRSELLANPAVTWAR